MKTVLEISCIILGWQGGTIHQVKAEMRKMNASEKSAFMRKVNAQMNHVSDLHTLRELSAITIEHLQFSSI